MPSAALHRTFLARQLTHAQAARRFGTFAELDIPSPVLAEFMLIALVVTASRPNSAGVLEYRFLRLIFLLENRGPSAAQHQIETLQGTSVFESSHGLQVYSYI